MIQGTTKALGRFLDPFVSESIWVQALNDLYSRGGKNRYRFRGMESDETQEGDKIR